MGGVGLRMGAVYKGLGRVGQWRQCRVAGKYSVGTVYRSVCGWCVDVPCRSGLGWCVGVDYGSSGRDVWPRTVGVVASLCKAWWVLYEGVVGSVATNACKHVHPCMLRAPTSPPSRFQYQQSKHIPCTITHTNPAGSGRRPGQPWSPPGDVARRLHNTPGGESLALHTTQFVPRNKPG